VFPDIGSKSAITRILNQEVGGGKPERAHEAIYVRSMEKAGFEADAVTGRDPFHETTDLVQGYEKASVQHLSALGFVFATEVTEAPRTCGGCGMGSSVGSQGRSVSPDRERPTSP
jgi:Iron-containing redox enzyme